MKQRMTSIFKVLALAVVLLLVLVTFPAAKDKTKGVAGIPSVKAEEIPDWMARWELARALSYAKRHDESVTEYQKLLKERPDLSQARIEMANVLFWQGKKQEALSILESVSTRHIDDSSKLLMADLYLSQKDYKKAEPLYREHLGKNPGDHGARLKLAEMLSWDLQYEASLAEYRAILAALPGDTQVRRKYAFVLMWAKKYDEAAAELRKTLK